jgi:cytochrome c-type biogenesis protein CcmH/NrfG
LKALGFIQNFCPRKIHAEAERLYRLLMKCDPADAAPPFNLGNMLRANGRNVEAEAAFRAATRADPTFAEAWYNLSDLLPIAAGQQLIGFGRKARRDEPGQDGTLQHLG